MKNRKIKVFTILILAISFVFTTTICASAASVKISKKSMTINAGKTSVIKVLNTTKKLTWTSSKKTVATVKATGKTTAKITAKKAGTTTITAKVGGKKYTCKVSVKYAVGSRQKPADPMEGITLTDWTGGKFYFELLNVYRGADAVWELKALDEWEDVEYFYDDRESGTDLMILEFYVQAIKGFNDSALWGSDIIGSSVYNESCNASIDDFDTVYLNKNDPFDFKLYNGGDGIMYYCAYVPDDLSAFSYKLTTKSFKDYWVRYEI